MEIHRTYITAAPRWKIAIRGPEEDRAPAKAIHIYTQTIMVFRAMWQPGAKHKMSYVGSD